MSDQTTDHYGVEVTPRGFVLVDGRNERPVARRNRRETAEALARKINGEPALDSDAEALAKPLDNGEFGPNLEEPKCFWI